jgi:hypothetical protein
MEKKKKKAAQSNVRAHHEMNLKMELKDPNG